MVASSTAVAIYNDWQLDPDEAERNMVDAVQSLLSDACAHAESNLHDVQNATSSSPYELHVAHAYATAVDGHSRVISRELNLRYERDACTRDQLLADGLERIGRAASKSWATAGAADIVERCFSLATDLRLRR